MDEITYSDTVLQHYICYLGIYPFIFMCYILVGLLIDNA